MPWPSHFCWFRRSGETTVGFVTTILHEEDASIDALGGQRVAVVGYGNQGRSWALNLRDSGLAVEVCVRADETRRRAEEDGFTTADLEKASEADVLCLLVPDDVIPSLPLDVAPQSLVVVASGYTLAFGRLDPPSDTGMVAPRMLGPEVRRCYEEGVGFITAVGVHHDVTGSARARTLALAKAIGGLRQGAIELTPHQEAVLDLAVEQALSPALRRVNESFVQVMIEQGIPLEAIVTELVLSGEVERTYRLVRLEGGAAQTTYHSPTSQYGQLSRADRFGHLDLAATMRDLVDHITSGGFADEWDAEREAGYPNLESLRARAMAPEILAFEADLRSKLGETAASAQTGRPVH
jgi:ketol-acid reductoisomerase